MTRLELRIDEIALHGVPQGMADGLGPLVEARLAELARAVSGHGQPSNTVGDTAGLAALVADRVWSQVSDRTGLPGLGAAAASGAPSATGEPS